MASIAGRVVRVLAVAAVALAATVVTVTGVAVQPAAAFVSPATLTLIPEHLDENPLVVKRAECPVGSVSARVNESGTSPAGLPVSFQGDYALDITGVWADSFYLESFYQRGSTATFTLTCFDGPLVGGVATGAATDTAGATYQLVTTNAAISAPATQAVNVPITVTGNCGTSTTIVSYTYFVFDQAFTQIGSAVTEPYLNTSNYSIAVGTGQSLGLAAGQIARVQVLCNSVTPVSHTASSRLAATTLTAAAAPPAPAGPAAAALAAGGTDSAAPIALALALLSGGGLVLLVRRRTSAPASR